MPLWEKIKSKIDTPVWLEWLFGLVFLLRIPSFFEPFWYGDEMIYLTLGQGVREGLVLYKDLHDNKPPLLYLLAAVAGNVFWFKVILAFWSLFTIYLFWKLVNHLFSDNQKLQKVATILFALLTTLPILEGNIANAELFFIGPIIAAFWIVLSKPHTFKNLLLTGVLFSIASLFKLPAAFDMGAVLLYWLLVTKTTFQNLAEIAKKYSIIILGFLIPIFVSFGWYYLRGALSEYWIAAFLQNVGYVSSFRPGDIQKPFLIKNLPMIIRGLIVFAGIAILYIKKNKLSKEFLFAASWLLISLFAVTLSERPYPHYLLQSVAAISILAGMFVAAKTMEQLYAIIPLTLAFLVPVYFKFYYYSTYSYFERFTKLITKQDTKWEYYNSFDKNVARNYKVSEFLIMSSKPGEKVFVWGDSSSIYALSRRLPPFKYVANYHITDFSSKNEVLRALKETPPKFIVITPNSEEFIDLRNFASEKYILVNILDGVEIWSLKTQ